MSVTRISRLFFLVMACEKCVHRANGLLASTVQKYCLGCHNSKLKNSKVAFDTLDFHKVADHSEESGKEWYANFGPAPCRRPVLPGRTRPSYAALVSSITTSLDATSAANPNPGRTDTFRRLNRTEYQNAIRDLLALDVDVTSLLPSDESSHGFDNVTVGDLSPTLLERYLTAAQKDQPAGDRQSGALARRRHDHSAARPDAGGALRGAAARNPRRHRRSLHVPARCRVRHSDPAHARSQRTRRRAYASATEVELMLDGERVQLFTVEPPPAGNDHLAGRQGSQRPHPREGRSAYGRRHVPEEDIGAARNRAAAISGAFQYGPASADSRRRCTRFRSTARITHRARATRPAAADFSFAARRTRREEERLR